METTRVTCLSHHEIGSFAKDPRQAMIVADSESGFELPVCSLKNIGRARLAVRIFSEAEICLRNSNMSHSTAVTSHGPAEPQFMPKEIIDPNECRLKYPRARKTEKIENHKPKEPWTLEELTCCISCRYFGCRSELMVDGGHSG